MLLFRRGGGTVVIPAVSMRRTTPGPPLTGRPALHQPGRGRGRVMPPLLQIAVDEQLPAQQGDQIRQGPGELPSQSQVFRRQHGGQRRPDLGLHRVGAGATEVLIWRFCLTALSPRAGRRPPAAPAPGAAGRRSQTIAIAGAQCRRPAWSASAPAGCPGASACLLSSPARRRSHAASRPVPNGQTASPPTGFNR